MSRRKKAAWKRTNNGTWTLSLGERGCRVTLRENPQKGGMIYREVWLGEGRKSRCSLHTRDRDHAEELGRKFLAALMAGQKTPVSDTPRLGALCDRFLKESAMLKDNTERSREEAETRLRIIRAILGDHRDVRTLSKNVIDEYEARRKAGIVRYGPEQMTRPARQRSVQADVKLLKQVLYWACATINPDGSRLLERNPLEFVKVKAEPDVQRPVASYERYEATVAAMREAQARYGGR